MLKITTESPVKRVFVNTSFLYVKMIITTLLSLYTTRLVLQILGVDDFGLYNLLIGVTVLLSFLNAAMMQSTQRFLSVHMGENNVDTIKTIFNNGVVLHLFFACVIVILLEIGTFFLFNDGLNIPSNKIGMAKHIYQLMVLMVVITIISAPYSAIINAKEDLWLFAIIEVIISFLKLVSTLLLYCFSGNQLVVYTYFILIVTILGVLLKIVWSYRQYPEVKLDVFRYCKKTIMKNMLSFCGWNTLGAMAQVGRTQGTAIVLNSFGGVAINAAYGIANQVNSLLVYFSQMMTTSIAPQIMKAKGENNINKMIYLSILTSKLSFYLSSLFAVPIMIELPFILHLWLGKVPEYTISFCYYVMCIFLLLQLYPGLVRLLQADGHIKYWQSFNTLFLLLPVPVGSFLLYKSYSIYALFNIMIIAQCATFISTLFFSKKYVALNIYKYLFDVVLKPVSILGISYLICSQLNYIHNEYIRFVLIIGLSSCILTGLFYFLVLDGVEKKRVITIINKKKCSLPK